MKISMIAAMAKNRVIGKNNALPWNIPEDFEYFKTTTLGHPIVMGRKTFDSLGKPLPRRENIVITRNQSFGPEGVKVFNSLSECLESLRSRFSETNEEVFIIGGEQIYREALSSADRIYLTVIEKDFEGDTKFPEFSLDEFKVTSSRPRSGEIPFSFIVYDRKPV